MNTLRYLRRKDDAMKRLAGITMNIKEQGVINNEWWCTKQGSVFLVELFPLLVCLQVDYIDSKMKRESFADIYSIIAR